MAKKIDKGAWEPKRCRHPGHEPPSMIVYTPGEHTHTCPGCKQVFGFLVHKDYEL